MTRLFIILALGACADTLDDRIAELDARADVDCGTLGDCPSQERAEGVATCLRDNLAAGVTAKAGVAVNFEEYEYIYATDGALVSLFGHSFGDDDIFTEYRCRDVGVSVSGVCAQLRAIDCEEVREW